MAVLKCEACGAPLSSSSGVVSICEYCGTENIINSNDNNFESQNSMSIEDIIVTSGEGELTDNPYTTDVYYGFGGRN